MAKTLSDLTRCRLLRDGVLSILRLPSAFRRHKATVPKLPLFKSFSNSYTSQNLRPLLSQTNCSRKSRFWGDGGFFGALEGAQPIWASPMRRLRAVLRLPFRAPGRHNEARQTTARCSPRTIARGGLLWCFVCSTGREGSVVRLVRASMMVLPARVFALFGHAAAICPVI